MLSGAPGRLENPHPGLNSFALWYGAWDVGPAATCSWWGSVGCLVLASQQLRFQKGPFTSLPPGGSETFRPEVKLPWLHQIRTKFERNGPPARRQRNPGESFFHTNWRGHYSENWGTWFSCIGPTSLSLLPLDKTEGMGGGRKPEDFPVFQKEFYSKGTAKPPCEPDFSLPNLTSHAKGPL